MRGKNQYQIKIESTVKSIKKCSFLRVTFSPAVVCRQQCLVETVGLPDFDRSPLG